MFYITLSDWSLGKSRIVAEGMTFEQADDFSSYLLEFMPECSVSIKAESTE